VTLRPNVGRADYLRRRKIISVIAPRPASAKVVGSGVIGIVNPVNVSLRRAAATGGVLPGLPVRVVNRGLELNQVPVCIAASNVVAVPIQPIMKYSAVAPPGIPGRLTMPPLNLPATGCIPVVAMSDQPGFAAKKPSKVGKFQ